MRNHSGYATLKYTHFITDMKSFDGLAVVVHMPISLWGWGVASCRDVGADPPRMRGTELPASRQPPSGANFALSLSP